MRIACLYPAREKWSKSVWVKDAMIRLGHDVRHYRGTGSTAAKEVADADAWADILLFEQKWTGCAMGDFVRLSAHAKAVWATWNADLVALEPDRSLADQLTLFSKSAGVKQETPWLRQMRGMDFVGVKERSLLNDYHALNVRASYLDQGCPSWMGACEHRESPEWDVLVIGKWGRSWQQRRHAAVTLSSEGFSVAWCGHAGGDSLPPGILPIEWTPPDKLPELASQAACVLCVDYQTDLDGYTSDRTWLVMGMGAVMLRPQGWLPDGPYLTYSDDESLLERVRQIRRDVDIRRQIGAAAREWVMKSHTVEHRCQQFLEEVSRCERSQKECADFAVGAAR